MHSACDARTMFARSRSRSCTPMDRVYTSSTNGVVVSPVFRHSAVAQRGRPGGQATVAVHRRDAEDAEETRECNRGDRRARGGEGGTEHEGREEREGPERTTADHATTAAKGGPTRKRGLGSGEEGWVGFHHRGTEGTEGNPCAAVRMPTRRGGARLRLRERRRRRGPTTPRNVLRPVGSKHGTRQGPSQASNPIRAATKRIRLLLLPSSKPRAEPHNFLAPHPFSCANSKADLRSVLYWYV